MNAKLFALIIALVALTLPAVSMAQSVPQSRPQIALSFAPLVKQVAPAVVNIYAQRASQQRDPLSQEFFNGAMPPGMNQERAGNSLGSGVIVRADGLIVTSNHVIKGAEQIRVVLSDKREFDAAVLTVDEHSDLALLHIDTRGEKLPVLELEDSDHAEIGDLVLAIGNPFGVGQTVTNGIISAIAHHAVGGSGDLDYFLQTDAAINPGNSGGALIAMDGRLVGINATIYSKTGGNVGIGFAVPSNMVRVVLNAYEHGQKTAARPWIGIEAQEITAKNAASLGLTQPAGVLLVKTDAGSPAEKAGLLPGDVVLALDEHPVEDGQSFRYRLATTPVGTNVIFTILRKGQKYNATVALISAPETEPRQKTRLTGLNPLSGAEIENISPAVSEELSIPSFAQGVIVCSVSGGVAANIGVQSGDIVLDINGNKIADVNTALTVLREPATNWRVTIQRRDEKMTIMVGG